MGIEPTEALRGGRLRLGGSIRGRSGADGGIRTPPAAVLIPRRAVARQAAAGRGVPACAPAECSPRDFATVKTKDLPGYGRQVLRGRVEDATDEALFAAIRRTIDRFRHRRRASGAYCGRRARRRCGQPVRPPPRPGHPQSSAPSQVEGIDLATPLSAAGGPKRRLRKRRIRTGSPPLPSWPSPPASARDAAVPVQNQGARTGDARHPDPHD
jgi:hypothetical protein